MEILFEIHKNLVKECPGGNEYTKQAFQVLPPLMRPAILDIGCGPGSQTLELARLSDGRITAVDIHQPYLDYLAQEAQKQGLRDRISCLNQTMMNLEFSLNSFDLIWAEGSLYFIGLEKALKEWHSLLKPQGYFVFSELVWINLDPPQPIQDFFHLGYPEMRHIDSILQLIPHFNYQTIHHFVLPEKAWWNYYLPLERRIKELRLIYNQDPEILLALESEQQEIEMYRKYSDFYSYSFFILQKA
jgi:SAM-dependent methyltransferase